MMISLSEPNIAGNELEYLRQCVETNFISSVGPFVEQFERDFAKFVGAPFAVAMSNGTAAIHIALILAGVDIGDDVMVSDFTFAASANPIHYQGARPILVDSDLATWNMDPELVVEELDRRTRLGIKQVKAVIVVHILGCPAQIEAIQSACERNGVCLIEDAAEALGASYTEGSYAGKQVGTIGKMGCFSFNGNKIMTTGGGGMLVTSDEHLARRAKHLSTQAKRPGYAYFHEDVGFNYRLTNLAAAVGLGQLERLDEFIGCKRAIAARYDAAFQSLTYLTLPPHPVGMAPTFWLYSVLFDGAWEGPLGELLEKGIQTRPIWTALHLMPPYQECQLVGSGIVSEHLCGHGLSLPCSTNLLPDSQNTVINAIVNLENK